MKKLIATGIFIGALALLLLATAHAAVAQDVTIKSVDNYGGYSNVYTDRPNTTVTITHVDGERWTGTTDSEGKITINAGYTLSKESLKIKLASTNQQGHVEGLVLPDTIYDKQPFSFAAPHVVEGEVVSVATVSGQVVQRSSADKYGRVFLAAGLPAGAYLISGNGQQVGAVEVKQRAGDALQHSADYMTQPMQLRNVPQSLKLNDSFTLAGNGFSPNASDMRISLTGSGKTETPVVLAATEDQLKLAPVQQLQPGTTQLTVTNQATGRTTNSYDLLLYDLKGHLEQSKLTSGQRTIFVLNSFPENVPMNVRATIISGPVSFGNGKQEVEGTTQNGRVEFPVKAVHGSGKFNIDFEGRPVESAGKASCSCGCGGTAQPACAHKACACSKTKTASDLKTDLKMPTSTSTGKAGCSCGCGGTAQPRCAHKGCGCS